MPLTAPVTAGKAWIARLCLLLAEALALLIQHDAHLALVVTHPLDPYIQLCRAGQGRAGDAQAEQRGAESCFMSGHRLAQRGRYIFALSSL